MANCIVPGCSVDAQNSLSIRLRRPDTSAIWAPNLDAHVCDIHATSGARVTVTYEATEAGQIETVTDGGDGHPAVRRTAIRRTDEVDD
jgi:hypothetical protein